MSSTRGGTTSGPRSRSAASSARPTSRGSRSTSWPTRRSPARRTTWTAASNSCSGGSVAESRRGTRMTVSGGVDPHGNGDAASSHDASGYPATLDVDYPDRPLNRLTTFFRAFTVIPIAIVLSTVSGATQVYSGGGTGSHATVVVVGAGGVLVAGPLLMILFR